LADKNSWNRDKGRHYRAWSRTWLGFLKCNGGMVFMAISSSASRSAREANSVMNIPPDPSHRWRRGAHMGSGPQIMRLPISRKNFKYRSKSITQRNLTEIELSRKSAAARKAPFEVFAANRLTRTRPRPAASVAPLPTLGGQAMA